MPKLSSLLLYLQTRHHHFIECIEHGKKKNWVVAVMALIVPILVFLSALPSFIEINFPKMSIWWAIISVLSAIAFIAIEGGYRLNQEKDHEIAKLQEHLEDLKHSIFALPSPELPTLTGPRLEMSNPTPLKFDDLIPGGIVMVAQIDNVETRFENTARNIAATIEFIHFSGEKIMSMGAWKFSDGETQNRWATLANLYMGQGVTLPLFGWISTSCPLEFFSIDERKMSINFFGILQGPRSFQPLGFGDWTIIIKLKGDNIEKELTLKVSLSPDQGGRIIPL